jgi:hypothetical protein
VCILGFSHLLCGVHPLAASKQLLKTLAHSLSTFSSQHHSWFLPNCDNIRSRIKANTLVKQQSITPMAEASPHAEGVAVSSGSSSKKHAIDLQEVQETVSRLVSHKGVLAVLILNGSGDIVTQSGGGDGAVGNPKLLSKMLHAADVYVRSMISHPEDDSNVTPENSNAGGEDKEGMDALLTNTKTTTEENISFVRIRTLRHEILVAPKFGFTLVVLQDPSVSVL